MGEHYLGILAVCLFVLSDTAQAVIIASVDFTTNIGTGLDSPDRSFRSDLSFDYVMAESGADGPYEDWSIATQEQLQTCLTEAGWIRLFDQGNKITGR